MIGIVNAASVAIVRGQPERPERNLLMSMSHDEFVSICNALGAPNRGWQKNLCQKAKELGVAISQPTISLNYNNKDRNISATVAHTMRTLADAIGSGHLPTGSNAAPTVGAQITYKDPDDDLTDEEIMDDIRSRFTTFHECIEAVVCGSRLGCLVSGPPGCGKSHGVSQFADRSRGKFVSITGDISPVNLYKKLYEVKDNGVVVFDDCDAVFADETKLNLLKGALDLKKPGESRNISWLKESRALVDELGEPIEKTFDFQGRVLFMTNIDFDREIERGTKISEHLKAFQDRTGYMTLGLHSKRRRMLRIIQVCQDSTIMEENGVSDPTMKNEILEFVRENRDRWRNLNLRLIVKLCGYRTDTPTKWEKHAKELEMPSRLR